MKASQCPSFIAKSSEALSLLTIMRWNLGLIVSIGIYGVLTEEAYWRAVGHTPYLYDYCFWFALVINGPSGFVSDYLAWLMTSDVETWFVLHYFLWGFLLWPQWRSYQWLMKGAQRRGLPQVLFYLLATLLIIGGSIAAYETWYPQGARELFVDQYFWSVRFVGCACSGWVLIIYAQIARKEAPALL